MALTKSGLDHQIGSRIGAKKKRKKRILKNKNMDCNIMYSALEKLGGGGRVSVSLNHIVLKLKRKELILHF